MQTYIALLRGINVGGNNKLPMKELVSSLTDAGLADVKTYIQSGNVIFKSQKKSTSDLESLVSSILSDKHSIDAKVMILSLPDFETAIRNNPFPEAVEAPNTLHLFFLKHPAPAPNAAKMEQLKADSESFKLLGTVFYLHAPDGIGRSKLAAQTEKAIGVPTTARNWRSATKILELAKQT